jgi:membrane-associated phospholipid phosphatase
LDTSIDTAADFIARNAVLTLLCTAALLLAATYFLWRMAETYGAALWTRAARNWDLLRKSALAERLRAVPILGRTLRSTLSAASYLGAHAIVSFVVALGALLTFVELAEQIGIDEELAAFDVALSEALGRHASRELLQTMAWITNLGDKAFLTPLVALVMLVLLAKRERLLAVAWVVAIASGGALNLALKALFARTRPLHEHGIVTAHGWSFPSGHATGAMLVYGLLGYVVIRHAPRAWHLPVAIAAVLLIVFVGCSRVLLQVHYLSDVLAGYASGAAWGALCIAGLEGVRRARTGAGLNALSGRPA